MNWNDQELIRTELSNINLLWMDMIRMAQPPPRMTVSQWAEQNRVLSRESSAEPGTWRNDRAEYQRAIMDAVSNPIVQRVTVKSSARVGKTEICNNIMGYFVDRDPCPIMMVQPTRDAAEYYSKEQLAPMIRDTPVLAAKVTEGKARDAGVTILHKVFPGGFINVVGANSPIGLRRSTIRVLLLDEVDGYPISAGPEGDPVELATKRTETFWNRKLIHTSTTTIDGVSRIQRLFDQSSQGYFHVACPHCGHMQTLVFPQIKFNKDDVERSTHYECAGCRKAIDHREKFRMVRHGKWIHTHNDRITHRGFFINALYSPWVTWASVVDAFLRMKDNRETLQVFLNTYLGQEFTDRESFTIDDERLAQRREEYDCMPRDAVVLTAAVDVQDDRLEAAKVAWGKGEQSWLIDHRQFIGSPEYASTWDALQGWLETPVRHELGIDVGTAIVAVDSGYLTHAVYKFVKEHQGKRYIAVKGYGGPGKTLIGTASRRNKFRAVLYPIGTDEAKTILYGRLDMVDSSRAGYMHFNKMATPEFFRQLTSERRVTRMIKGRPVITWEVRPSRRNEILDLYVYNLAAIRILNPNIDRITEQIKSRAAAAIESGTAPPPPQPRRQPIQIRSRKPNRWRY